MNDLKRDFKGVWIPKAVWFNKDITPLEKMFLAEIDSLDSDLEKGCFASNEHFAKMFDVSEGRAANIISSLRVRGYIVTIFFDGRNRGIRLSENVKAGFTKNVKSGSRKTLTLVHGKRDANNIDTILVTNIEEEKEKAISPGIALPLSSSSSSSPEPGSFPVEEKPLYAETLTPAAPAAPRFPHQVYGVTSTAPIEAFDIGAGIESIRVNFKMKDAFSMSRRVPAQLFDEYLNDFHTQEAGVGTIHHNQRELNRHFLNYAATRYKNEQARKAAAPAANYAPPSRPTKTSAFVE